MNDKSRQMKDQVLKLIRGKGPELAIKQLNFQEDTLRAMGTYEEVTNDLYWQDKDLPNAIALAEAGIEHGLESAADTDNDELAFELRAKAKALAYNLASFTWSGWDEPGIEITPEQAGLGLEAARTNLKLAVELKRDALRQSYAHWMLAAHQLAGGDHEAAQGSFRAAADLGKKAGQPSAELLGLGFAALVDLLQAPADPDRQGALDDIKARLEPIEHGPEYVKQLDTAWKVFHNS